MAVCCTNIQIKTFCNHRSSKLQSSIKHLPRYVEGPGSGPRSGEFLPFFGKSFIWFTFCLHYCFRINNFDYLMCMYHCQTKFEGSIYKNQRAVGRSVCCPKVCCHGNGIIWAKMGTNLRRKLLPQFVNSFYEIWHRCSSGDVNLQDTYFGSGKKCVAMVTACYWQNVSWQKCFISVWPIFMECLS